MYGLGREKNTDDGDATGNDEARPLDLDSKMVTALWMVGSEDATGHHGSILQ